MTTGTNTIRALITATRFPYLLYRVPTLTNPIIIDFNPPTAFRGGFTGTSGTVYYPAGADVTWIPAGFTKVAIASIAPANGRISLAANTAYVFAPTNSLDPATGYAYRVYRINAQTAGAAVKDVKVIFPLTGYLPHELMIDGGVNVQIIGGEIRGSYPPQTYTGYTGVTNGDIRAVLQCRNVKSSVYLEGVIVDAMELFGLDAYEVGVNSVDASYNPAFYMQRCILKGCQSDFATGLHADAYQLYGRSSFQYLDRVYMESQYQGAFLDQQFITSGFFLNNVQTKYKNPDTGLGYAFYLLSALDTPTNAGNPAIMPVTMKNVYVDRRNNASLGEWATVWGLGSIYPTTEAPVGAEALLNAAGDRATWPKIPAFNGYVKKGAPPNGNMVLSANIGAGYVPSGYR